MSDGSDLLLFRLYCKVGKKKQSTAADSSSNMALSSQPTHPVKVLACPPTELGEANTRRRLEKC